MSKPKGRRSKIGAPAAVRHLGRSPRTGRVPKLLPALFGRSRGERAALLDRNDYQREVVASLEHAHFTACAVCGSDVADDDVSAVRCATCPRSFHRRCLGARATSSSGRCGCERDSSVCAEEDIVRTAGDAIDGRIARAYGKYAGEADHGTVCRMLSDALAIVQLTRSAYRTTSRSSAAPWTTGRSRGT